MQFFLSNIYGVFQGIAQYTYDNMVRDQNLCLSVFLTLYQRKAQAAGIALNVTGLCQIMNNDSIPDPLDRVRAVWDWNNAYYGQEGCNSNNYTDFIRQLSDTSYTDRDTGLSTVSVSKLSISDQSQLDVAMLYPNGLHANY